MYAYIYTHIHVSIWTVFEVYIFREGDSEEGVETASAGRAVFPYALL